MIRSFTEKDLATAHRIHQANALPEVCFPNLYEPDGKPNRLFVVKEVFEDQGRPVLMCFLKMTSELYLLIDHELGTPAERWEWLKEFKAHIEQMAWMLGLEQMSAWLPVEIEQSFGKRIEELGFVRSPWSCYTLNL